MKHSRFEAKKHHKGFKDPHRPQYHFSPPANWMNDPNGFIQWDGMYHLFYQHNPEETIWGNIHWGHAVSPDLVHWSHLPVALAPTPGGPDKDGCWSGVIVDHAGVPTMLYTGVFPEVQCLATGSDDLLTWEKHAANPVLSAPPENLDVVGFRDPCVWQDNGIWYMTLGSGLRGMGGAVLLYQSRDLLNWEYVSVLLGGDKDHTGEMWECPAFFPLEDKYVLLVSIFPRAGTYYFVGSFDGTHFTPESEGVLDFGAYFFAPQTLLDATGRRIMIGWIWEGRSEAAQQIAGWSGVQSIPRQLTLRNDQRLGVMPIGELQTLRGKHVQHTDVTLSAHADVSLVESQHNSLEIIAEFAPGTAQTLGIKLLHSRDGSEYTQITYSPSTSQLVLEPVHSTTTNPDVSPESQSGILHLAEHETLTLHIFVDRSVIEIFVDGHFSLTGRIYPTRVEGNGIHFFSHDGSSVLSRLDVWEMRSI